MRAPKSPAPPARPLRRNGPRLARAGLTAGLTLAAAAWFNFRAGSAPANWPARPAELFNLTSVWTVHLQFTPAEWAALEPQGGPGRFGGPFFGGPPRPGGPGPGAGPGDGPGGPGGPPGGGPGGGGFGPGMFLGPAFRERADADHDGRVSAEELRRLGEHWFDRWDPERRGAVTLEELRAGLNATLGGPPPGAGPGGPGAPGGPPGGLNLQGREGQRNGLAAMLGIDFPTVPAALEFAGQLLGPVHVRYKGNGTFMESRGTLKRSFKVDLNDLVPRQKLAGVAKLNLHNNVTDPSWMNEVLAHRLYRDAGVPAPRSAYARVYLTVPGEHDRTYLGLYSLVENPDRNFAGEFFGTRKGALFKPVTKRVFEDLGDDWRAYRQTYDPKTPVAEEETRRVIAFCKLVSHADDARFAAELGDYLDLEEFARFMAVTVWLCTLDSLLGPGQNYLVHLHPVSRRFQFIPWDLDHAFGQFPLIGTQELREQLSIHRPWQGDSRFLERVFQVPAFKQRYLAVLAELNRTLCRPERLRAQVDELAAVLRPAVAEESPEKLEHFERAVAGQSAEPYRPGGFGGARRSGGPGPGFAFAARKPIKGFVPARWQSIEDQLAGRAEGQTPSGLGFGPGRGPRGPGGPGGLGPGPLLAPPWMAAMDTDHDGRLARAELLEGLDRWFRNWDTDRDAALTDAELRAGLNQAFSPPAQPGPGGPPEPFPPGPPGAGAPFRAPPVQPAAPPPGTP